MKKSILLFIFLFFAAEAFSQTAKWDTLQTDDGELTLDLPSGCYSHFYNQDGITVYESNGRERIPLKEMRILSCYRDGALLNVEIYETKQAKTAARILQKNFKIDGEQTSVGNDFFAVAQIKKDSEYVIEQRVIAGEKHIYLITAAARSAPNQTALTFLSSLKFADEKTAQRNEKAVLISSLENRMPEVISDQDAKSRSFSNAPTINENAALKKIIVLSLPTPSYTNAARKNQTKGNLSLRLTFGAEGRITHLQVLRDLPDGLLREAVISALRTKFLPAELDSHPVASTQTVEYKFGIY